MVTTGLRQVDAPSEAVVLSLRGWRAGPPVEHMTVSWQQDLASSGPATTDSGAAGAEGLTGRVEWFGAALAEAARAYSVQDEVSAGLFDRILR